MSTGESKPAPADGSVEQRLEIITTSERAPALEAPCLLLGGPSGRGKLFPLPGTDVVLGRAPESDVYLDHPSVSNHHARLYLRDGEWWLEDLGSTNGTFLNGTKVSAPLHVEPGSALVVGDQRMVFFSASLGHEQTLFLGPNSVTDRLRTHEFPNSPQTVSPMAPVTEEDPIAAAFRLYRTIQSGVFHYIWLATILISLGAAGGVLHARLRPPIESAAFDVVLKEEASANPVEDPRTESRIFFASAQSYFTSLPLIAQTLADLGKPHDDVAVHKAAENLSFERQETVHTLTWHGEYAASTSAEAVAFLERHLQNYLQSSIERALQVFRAQSEFLAAQLKEAGEVKREAEARFIAFREAHPDILPGATPTEARKSAFGAPSGDPDRLRTTAGQLAYARQQLAELDPLAQKRMQDINDAGRRVAEARLGVQAARNRGLGEQHPEVVKLKQELAAHESQAAIARSSKTTAAEKRANPEYRRMEDEVRRLEIEANAVSAIAASSQRISPKAPERPKSSRPQLEAEYLDAANALDSAQQLAVQLTKKLRASELQKKLERATAEAHYDIITPPTAIAVSPASTAIKRGVLGSALGFLLTLLVAGTIEFRRLAARYAV